MNSLFKVVLLFGAVVAALPWLNFSLDASGLREDAKMAPELSRTGTAIKAHAVAHHLIRAAKGRGFELTPEDVRVEVGASNAAPNAPGGQIQVAGAQPLSVQKVTLHVKAERYVYGVIQRQVEFTIQTEGFGVGGASTFPASAEEEEEAQAPAEIAAPADE